MGIKSKNSEKKPGKRRSKFWPLITVLLCAAATVGAYPEIQQNGEDAYYTYSVESEGQAAAWPNYYSDDAEANLRQFTRYLYVGSYGMYWNLQQSIQQRVLSPSDVFFSAYGDEDFEGRDGFDSAFRTWMQSYFSLLESFQVEVSMVDLSSGESYSNSSQDLSQYDKGGDLEKEAPFFMKLTFDENGNVSIDQMENIAGVTLSVSEVGGMTKERVLNWMEAYYLSDAVMSQPENVALYVYSIDEECYVNGNGASGEAVDSVYYREASAQSIGGIYLAVLIFLTLCAVFLPVYRRVRRESAWIKKVPMEGALAAFLAVCILERMAVSLCTDYVTSSWVGREVLMLLIQMAFYTAVYGAWLVGAMVMLQITDMGPKPFVQEKSICFQTVNRVYGGGKGLVSHFLESIRNIDLSDQSDKWLLKVVGLNFVILFFCCIFWFWGIFAILVYSVVLFFLLRHYMKKIKKDYGVLLSATSRMAQGDLQMDVEEDLGVFEPVKQELAKVNSGFRKAVEQEMKSQSMKTELITNVSHDLKTPLTAIITYVNLLKDENITPEERRGYVDILDRKSLRLKKLIEDLFEVSKAASGNIQVEKSRISLGEMVQQAAAEQADSLEKAGIDLRLAVPEERITAWLDGEKTYRILENLLVNVSKYALTGTRAYLSLTTDGEWAYLVLKNISAQELSEEPESLTERFVRGDKSRNTEGSGLGLAIVKSFVELQGGRFSIVIDGDLFKAQVRLPLGQALEGETKQAEEAEKTEE